MNQAILQIVCGVLGTFAFALFFHVAPRHLVLATVGGGLSWLLYLLVFAQGNGVFLSALAASFGICLWSEIMARVRKAPTNIFLIPGIIPLLPGGSLYYTMNALINGDMATVIQRGKETGLMALGIVVGILIASEIVRLFFWAVNFRYNTVWYLEWVPLRKKPNIEVLDMYEEIRKEAAAAAQEICQVAKLQKGQILVVGCSTSEVTGHTVGSDSSPAIGQAIYEGIQQVLAPKGIYLAAQCCEHLNRAIMVEAEAAGQAELCNVVPQPKAGGSFATAAYHGFQHPVALEEIRADAGLDIGGTLIGMHLKKVAVPVRLEQNRVGQAMVLAARVRPKYIGGERAIYNEDLK